MQQIITTRHKNAWPALPLILALAPPLIAAPQLVPPPQLQLAPTHQLKPAVSDDRIKVEAAPCLKAPSDFFIRGKKLNGTAMACAVECSDKSPADIQQSAAGSDDIRCSVKQLPSSGHCRVGAKKKGRWIASAKRPLCADAAMNIAPSIKTPAAKRPRPDKKPPLPQIKPGLARPDAFVPKPLKPLKPKIPDNAGFVPAGKTPAPTPTPAPSSDGTTRRTDIGLQHTPRQGLVMTGLGNSATREWRPIVLDVRQGLTMRGLGDSRVTDYAPINLTVTTPLTMRGTYTGGE